MYEVTALEATVAVVVATAGTMALGVILGLCRDSRSRRRLDAIRELEAKWRAQREAEYGHRFRG